MQEWHWRMQQKTSLTCFHRQGQLFLGGFGLHVMGNVVEAEIHSAKRKTNQKGSPLLTFYNESPHKALRYILRLQAVSRRLVLNVNSIMKGNEQLFLPSSVYPTRSRTLQLGAYLLKPLKWILLGFFQFWEFGRCASVLLRTL